MAGIDVIIILQDWKKVSMPKVECKSIYLVHDVMGIKSNAVEYILCVYNLSDIIQIDNALAFHVYKVMMTARESVVPKRIVK